MSRFSPRTSLAALAAAATLAPLALLATPAAAAPAELANSGGISVRNGAGMSLASTRSGGASAARAKTTNGITAHGGPIILGQTHAYYIWYGQSDTKTVDILTHLGNNIGRSSYFNINTTYYSPANVPVTNDVALVRSIDVPQTSASLSDADIQSVVASAIRDGRLPSDTNGVYFVLTAPGVTASSGFLTQYCGWHTNAAIGTNGQDIKYSFVGNPNGSSACLQQTTASPNGDVNADGMASVLSHELEEAVTDPDLNAWFDARGQENADKCAWTFGSTTTTNGALSNVTLGGRRYLIQQNWLNAGGGRCAMSY